MFSLPDISDIERIQEREKQELRDKIAIEAMKSIIGLLKGGAESLESTHLCTARDAYAFADAMLKQRDVNC